MKQLECNQKAYYAKMTLAVLTVIAAWCGPVALFIHLLSA